MYGIFYSDFVLSSKFAQFSVNLLVAPGYRIITPIRDWPLFSCLSNL